MKRCGGRVRIEHDGGPLEPGCDLREQFQPPASERGFQDGEAGDVPARAVKPRDDAAGDGITHVHKDDRDRPRLPLDGNGRRGPARHDDVGFQADQLVCERWYPIDVSAGPTKVHPRAAAIGPTQARNSLSERGTATLRLRIRIVFIGGPEHADAPHPLALLRPRRKRPRRCRAAEKRDELAAPDHSITSSAVASSVGGTSMRKVRAVCRLMTNSNLVERMTGKSAGFSPLRMRAV